MDLLCQAYGEEEEGGGEGNRELPNPPPLKRNRSSEQGYLSHYHHHDVQNTNFSSSFSTQLSPLPAVEGRYVSKRERALQSSSSTFTVSNPQTISISSPVVGSIADSDLPCDILASLRLRTTIHANKIAGRLPILLNGHTGVVNSIQWSRTHAHLLASAGMDWTVHIWNVWNKGREKARVFRYHTGAVKDVRWSPDGLHLLSCGYDCTTRLVDIEKGTETKSFKEDQIVEVIGYHPIDSNIFISGGSRGFLRLWDSRSSKIVHEYRKDLGPILDIEFSADGKYFVSSTDTSRSNISENSIIVWDVSREVPLSNQVYGEAYTCPCVRYHPTDACFVAQSNGNYVAIFSAKPPFKLDKYKRYEGHGVWGYPIKCNFSLDGMELASGSSDGCIYFYNHKSSKLVRKMKAFEEACIDVAFHPLIPNVIASCSWAGEVCVFD